LLIELVASFAQVLSLSVVVRRGMGQHLSHFGKRMVS
jgi:hypothetical protein